MKKILVIDDDELLTKTFSRLLQKLQYDVVVMTRPEDAVTLAAGGNFDLILCDIRMPGKNGVETIREIQAGAKKSGRAPVPVIFLTGFADNKLEQEAQALNPVAYIYKPFDTVKLLELISSTLKNSINLK